MIQAYLITFLSLICFALTLALYDSSQMIRRQKETMQTMKYRCYYYQQATHEQ